MWGSRDPLLEFLGPLLNTFGTVKAGNFMFVAEMDGGEFYRKNAKLGQNWSSGGQVTHFWNFGTPLISPGRMKLETLYLAQR